MAIIGTVAGGREALISLDLLGPGESRARIEAVVDTGFTGHLVLPPALVGELGLPLRGSRDTLVLRERRVRPPVHPGKVLELEFLEPLEMTAYQLAKAIGVMPPRVYESPPPVLPPERRYFKMVTKGNMQSTLKEVGEL